MPAIAALVKNVKDFDSFVDGDVCKCTCASWHHLEATDSLSMISPCRRRDCSISESGEIKTEHLADEYCEVFDMHGMNDTQLADTTEQNQGPYR